MKKYKVTVGKLVVIWMREYYEVEAENPDEAEKQVDSGFGELYDKEFLLETEKSIPDSWNNNNPTVIYKVEEAD